MKKWKIEKKYITLSVLALIVIIAAITFQNFLGQEAKNVALKETISSTIAPIMAGFIMAYLLNPVLKFSEKFLFMPLAGKIYAKEKQLKKRKGLSRTLGILFTIALFMLLLIGGLGIVIPQIYVSIVKIIGDVPEYYAEIESLVLSFMKENDVFSQYVLSILDEAYLQLTKYVNSVILPNIDKVVRGITTGIIGGLKIILNIVLAIIISIYVLFEKEKLISYGKKLAYSYLNTKHANIVIAGVRHVNTVFGGFINGKIVDSFIIGVLCYIFMLVAGFEYTVLISIFVGVTNVIPYFGPFIGAIPSILILLMTEPKQGLIFAVFVLLLQQLDGNVIGPLILGDKLKMSSMWILIAILIGGGLFGVPGMILGAPTLACIYALVKNDCKKKLTGKDLPVESGEYLYLDKVGEENEFVYIQPDNAGSVKENKKDSE